MCTGSKPKAPKAPPPPAEAAQAPPMTSRMGKYADEARQRRATGGVGLGTILTGTRGVTDKPTTSGTPITASAPEITKRFVTSGMRGDWAKEMLKSGKATKFNENTMLLGN